MAVFKQPDANTVKIVDSIYERLPTYRAQIPASVKMELLLIGRFRFALRSKMCR